MPANSKGSCLGVASWEIVGSGHRQLWVGGVVRRRNWMEDQEAASSKWSQSAKESQVWFHVRLSWLRITGNLHDIFSKCPLSIPQIAHLTLPDTRAGMLPDPACTLVRFARCMESLGLISVDCISLIKILPEPITYGALQFQIPNSTIESSPYSPLSCSEPVLLNRRAILMPLLLLVLLPILSDTRLRSA